MTIRVVNKCDPGIQPIDYLYVDRVEDCLDEYGNFAKRIVDNHGDTATYRLCDWQFYKLDWMPL